MHGVAAATIFPIYCFSIAWDLRGGLELASDIALRLNATLSILILSSATLHAFISSARIRKSFNKSSSGVPAFSLGGFEFYVIFRFIDAF